MKREEHLKYCKICLNRKMDLKVGLVCSLTDKIAEFDETCIEFKEDSIIKEIIESEPDNEKIESTVELNNGAQWFLWIFGLSAINTLILFFGGSVSFIFGLGITQLFEALFIEVFGDLNFIGVLISIFISAIFILIWFFAKKLSKPAFIIGMIIYGLDGLLLFMFDDYWSFGVHIYALFMIFKGYQSIKDLKEQKTFANNAHKKLLNSVK